MLFRGICAEMLRGPIDEIDVYRFYLDEVQFQDVDLPLYEGEKPIEHEWTINAIGEGLEHLSMKQYDALDALTDLEIKVDQILQKQAAVRSSLPATDPVVSPTPVQVPSSSTDLWMKYALLLWLLYMLRRAKERLLII